MTNKLEQLKKMTDVVADTGDIEAIAKYTPLDATTNPSLLLKAAALPQYQHLMTESLAEAKSISGSSEQQIQYAATLLGVKIGCEILNIIPGRISTEVDARYSFDTRETLNQARNIIALYAKAGIGRERVLIKIASTWEGIRAAEVLEKEGINCNLTLLFSFEQAAAAADAGVFLISPFVGRILDWYKKDTDKDSYEAQDDPGVLSVTKIYNYYRQQGFDTLVMGASFRNAGEIEQLAGCDRLTIGPQFLEELQNDQGTLEQKLSADTARTKTEKIEKPCLPENFFRFHLNGNAMATEKLAEGIRGFVVDQIKLEGLLKTK